MLLRPKFGLARNFDKILALKDKSEKILFTTKWRGGRELWFWREAESKFSDMSTVWRGKDDRWWLGPGEPSSGRARSWAGPLVRTSSSQNGDLTVGNTPIKLWNSGENFGGINVIAGWKSCDGHLRQPGGRAAHQEGQNRWRRQRWGDFRLFSFYLSEPPPRLRFVGFLWERHRESVAMTPNYGGILHAMPRHGEIIYFPNGLWLWASLKSRHFGSWFEEAPGGVWWGGGMEARKTAFLKLDQNKDFKTDSVLIRFVVRYC